MSGRRGRQKRQPQPSALPAPWGALPTELLVEILRHLTLTERHRSAVRVSRAWQDACYAPALLRHLEIGYGFYSGDSWSVARLQALCTWLVRRRPAQHADGIELNLFLPTSRHHEEPVDGFSAEAMLECACLEACMAALAAQAGSRLQTLALYADCIELAMGGWPAGLTSLTSLCLGNPDGKLVLSPALQGLRGLKELDLYASSGVEAEHNLPPCVTRLSWEETVGFELPDALSTLHSLRHLTVACWNMEHEDFAVLPALTSLRHLRLTDALVPGSLHSLTWLRSLHMEALERQEGLLPGLEAALPALQQLTALALGSVPLWRPGLLDALNALPRLQRLAVACAWDGYDDEEGSSSTLPPDDLPVLPFLRRLSWLGIDGDLLMRNPHLLSAASRLQHLWLLGDSMRRRGYGRSWRHLMKQARQHPQLRSISLRPSCNWQGYVEPNLAWYQWHALQALSRACPHITFHDYPFKGMTIDELWLPFFAD